MNSIQDAQQTLDYCDRILSKLAGYRDQNVNADITMFPRHAEELHQYLHAHRSKVSKLRDEVEALSDPDDALFNHMLATQRFELDAALHFVEESFIKPRATHGQAWALEAADWLCVEGFQIFVKDTPKSPCGPLVAISAQRSPAVWKEDAELKIPTLFVETKIVSRGAADESRLPPFPVVCLPSDMRDQPELYPLLSHEVGHAVDSALEISPRIRKALEGSPHKNYWDQWMREIVADAVGVILSGEAFVMALWRFVQRSPLDRDFTPSNSYPPLGLRMAFLNAMLQSLGKPGAVFEQPATAKQEFSRLGPDAVALLSEFTGPVLRALADNVFDGKIDEWRTNLDLVRNREAIKAPNKFRLLFSISTLLAERQNDQVTLEEFGQWHLQYRAVSPPEWMAKGSSWEFTEKKIPTLRPTFLGPDGLTKIPPVPLLATHQRIALIGATHNTLCANLAKALEVRTSPWKQLHIYFASDTLLRQVWYFKSNGTRQSAKEMIAERTKAYQDLEQFCRTQQLAGKLESYEFFTFTGQAIFASFWDWTEPGGRVHISAQLPGISIKVCPSMDHLWVRDRPSVEYQRYVSFLDAIAGKSRPFGQKTKPRAVVAARKSKPRASRVAVT